MTLSLLGSRRFAPLFWTQALGAFNDNLFKSALVVAVTFRVATEGLSEDALVNAATALIILPFFLFSATAGQLADRFDKARIIQFLKVTEALVMVVGAIGFLTESLPLLFGALFLMGMQSAFFGPLKYGIVPQHLRDEELVAGNGLIEAGTFGGILVGTIAGGLVISLPAGSWLIGGATLVVAMIGFGASLFIPTAPSTDASVVVDKNPVRATLQTVRAAKESRPVWLSILALSWFWFVGALVLAQLPLLAKDVLRAEETTVTFLLAVFSVGVGVGSVGTEKLTGGRVELALVPIAGFVISIFTLDFAYASSLGELTARVYFDLFMMGAAGGLFAVPLFAVMQKHADPKKRSRVIAGNNLINALFMVGAAAFAVGMRSAGLSIPALLAVTALVHLAVTAFITFKVQRSVVRLLVSLLVRTVYRVRREGFDHIPDDGPALLVCNHPSFADSVILGGLCRRPIRFVLYHKIYRIPALRWFFDAIGAIPIAPKSEDPACLKRAMDSIDEALAQGEVVAIFPEGKLSRDGEIDEFKPGVERILARRPVPVIPIALRGMWGSFFSHAGGAPMAKRPQRFWSRVELVAGDVMTPSAATAGALQRAVQELRGDAR